jgi:hypothetical protein
LGAGCYVLAHSPCVSVLHAWQPLLPEPRASICSCLSYWHIVCASPHLTTYLYLQPIRAWAARHQQQCVRAVGWQRRVGPLRVRPGTQAASGAIAVLTGTKWHSAVLSGTLWYSAVPSRTQQYSAARSGTQWHPRVRSAGLRLYAPGARNTESSNCEPSTVAPECAIGTAIHLTAACVRARACVRVRARVRASVRVGAGVHARARGCARTL